VERTSWFNKDLGMKITNRGKILKEDDFSQDLLMYLHDKDIHFSFNQHKQGLRPDVETTHIVIEIKIIYEQDSKNIINEKLNTAKIEIEKQKDAHSAHHGLILIYNTSTEYRIVSKNPDIIKIIDLQIAMYNISPSKDSRTLLSLE